MCGMFANMFKIWHKTKRKTVPLRTERTEDGDVDAHQIEGEVPVCREHGRVRYERETVRQETKKENVGVLLMSLLNCVLGHVVAEQKKFLHGH